LILNNGETGSQDNEVVAMDDLVTVLETKDSNDLV
jgi:hypothetical protein